MTLHSMALHEMRDVLDDLHKMARVLEKNIFGCLLDCIRVSTLYN